MSDTYVVPHQPRVPWKIGMTVKVMNSDGASRWLTTVAKVGKKTIKTKCGRHWDLRGWWIGSTGTYPFPWIKKMTKREQQTLNEFEYNFCAEAAHE